MIKILFVCHGNICRSPMAQSVFAHMAAQKGLSDRIDVDSAAVSREEIGNEPHYGTADKLREKNIPLIPHKARRMTEKDYEEYDYLIGMDSSNIRIMQRIAGGDPQKKIYKMMYFAGSDKDVADPWYTGNFDETYRDISEGLNGLMEHIMREDPRL